MTFATASLVENWIDETEKRTWFCSNPAGMATSIIYPDAGHAAEFQYPELFVDDVDRFP